MSVTYTRFNSGPLDDAELILCTTDVVLSNVKVRLVVASTYGEVDKASDFTPNADLNDLLKNDCIKIRKMTRNFLGSWDPTGGWLSFKTYNDGIPLNDRLTIIDTLGFQIKFEQGNSWTAGRKLYIGVEVYGE